MNQTNDDNKKADTTTRYEVVPTRKMVSNWLMEPGNNFCIMPYVHLAVESDGGIRPCCMGSPLKDDNGKPVSIAGKTIGEIIQHPARQKMIDAFDRNEQFANCSECWKDNSENSARVKFSTNHTGALEYTLAAMQGTKPEQRLTWLEVKPGNRCNLKCRICGPHNSSSWTKDSFNMGQELGRTKSSLTFKQSHDYQYNEQCKWIDEVDVWCNTDQLEHLELIHMMGGEPFMVPEHFELYRKIIADPKIDHSKISIWYNTNGTYFPTDEQLEVLSQFRDVRFSLSIDDIGKRFEYQRSLASWDSVKKNLIKFKDLESSAPRKWFAEADPTTSIYNIWYLEEYVDTMLEMGYEDLRKNTHYVAGGINNIRSLHPDAKKKIADHHANTKHPWVTDAIKYMYYKEEFNRDRAYQRRREIATLDKYRKESFAEVFPEMWELIKDEYK